MLEILKFVKGAIGKKDIVPSMKHFQIKNGHILAYNGELAIHSLIPVDIDCQPEATSMYRAIDRCNDVVSLTLLSNNKLSIKSKKFKVAVNCLDEPGYEIKPEGDIFKIDGELIVKVLSILIKFIGDDASRPWSNGILFKNQSAFATNNICLVQHWLEFNIPMKINIPKSVITEVLRVKEYPHALQISDNSITFHYSNDKWIRSQLLSTEWPDIEYVLDVESNQVEINKELFEGLENIKPFLDELNRVYFYNGCISTMQDTESGAVYNIDNFNYACVFVHDKLSLLKDVATHIDFSQFPKPCPFVGDNLRGVIIGLRL